MTLTLSKQVTPEALSRFSDDVGTALASGVTSILVDIDELETLESATIAALIRALRDAREHAAAVALRASRKKVLETLYITALDRVFTIVTPEAGRASEVPAPRARPRVKLPRRVASIAFALAAGSAIVAGLGRAPAGAQADPSPSDVVRNVVAENARISSYQASIAVVIQLRSFPYISKKLTGTTYFKRPANYEVVFDSVPSVAKGFDKLYSDIDDPTSWDRRFVFSLAGEKSVDGHRDLVIRLVQRVRGMIDHEDVAIDPATWRIDSMEWHYYNGGIIAMSQTYESVGSFTVLASQHATIHIPYVHAAADAVYSDYKTNVAIDDSVFTRTKR